MFVKEKAGGGGGTAAAGDETQGSMHVRQDALPLSYVLFPPYFVYSSFDEHLGCLHLLAIMNNAVRMCVYIYPEMK